MKKLVIFIIFSVAISNLANAGTPVTKNETDVDLWNDVVINWPKNPFRSIEILDSKLRLNPKALLENTRTIKADGATSLCLIAELKKRLGDPEAEDYYKQAIAKDHKEPLFELLLADYHRNIRGPKKPLFPEAEKHYFEALRKLEALKDSPDWESRYDPIRKRVDRALLDLYQEDGVPLVHRTLNNRADYEPPPIISFATINRYGFLTTDPDRVDDARSFTSESLFVQSATRLNRPLTRAQVREIARAKETFDNFDRLRFRYENLPVVDLYYGYRHINDAQITNFFLPTRFNNVNVNEFGIALEKTFNAYPYFDGFLRGAYTRVVREGLIEFLPDKTEDINQFQVEGAISTNLKGILGPDKAILNVKYAYQDIDSNIQNPPQRDRNIFSSTLTYQVGRPLGGILPFYGSPFASKGVEFFGGYARDIENFGGVNVSKNDFFFGVSAKGIGPGTGPIDLTLQPTWFTGDVEDDPSQDTQMYRTNFTLLYRIWDEDQFAQFPPNQNIFAYQYCFCGFYPAFLHFAIPFRHDVATDGPSYFENFTIGAELAAKFVTVQIGRTTFLASVRYDFQRFYNIDKSLNLFSLNLSMGF